MANTYDMPPLRPEPERDSFGRYVLPDPENPAQVKHFTRATTLAKALDDTYNLHRYQQRMITQGFKVQPELLDSIDLMEDENKLRDILQDVADQAYDAAGGNESSTRGTQLHYFTEAVDTGHVAIEQVPEEYRHEVAAYVAAMDRHGIVRPADGVERIVFNATANIVGTADRLPVIFPDGTRMVGDVKSGKDLSYSWGAIACQLAIYADADAMVAYDEHGNPFWDAFPVVEKDVGLVMHVPVDKRKCDLYLVDLKAGRAAVELALEVREYRRRKNLHRSLAVGRYGMPPVAPGGDLFSAAPPADEAQTASSPAAMTPLEVVTNNEVPQGGGVVMPDSVGDLDPLEEAQALLDTAKDKAADARNGRKRRNSKQVAADKAAAQAETAIPNAETLTEAALGLAEAYGFSLEDELDPETPPAPLTSDVLHGRSDEPEQEAVARTEARPEPEPEKVAAYPLPTAQPADTGHMEHGPHWAGMPPETPAVTHGETKYGTHVARHDGEDDASLRNRVRVVEVQQVLSRITTQDEAAAAYEEYQDVWTHYHTNLAKGRLNAVAREAEQAAAQEDPIRTALDACRTAEDMGRVWEQFQAQWNDEYTAYGQSVLAKAN